MQYQYFYKLFHNGKAYAHQKIRLLGISDTEFMVCLFLFKHQVMSQKEVSEALKLDKTTLSRAFSSLEKKGYVQRNVDERNRRKTLPSLTAEGLTAISNVEDIYEQWVTDISESFSEEEKKQFEHFCQRLLQASEKISGEESSWNTNKSN